MMQKLVSVGFVLGGILLVGVMTASSQSPLITGLSLSNDVLTVTFTGGELEIAPAVSGPWTGTGNTNGDYSEVIRSGDRSKFYRVVDQSLPSAPGPASEPSPANGATSVAINVDLNWTADPEASSHDVYFGTSSPGTYRDNQAGTTFNPGILANNTTYYWRIDEVNAGGTNTGTVWSFTTASALPLVISNLSPPTNAVAPGALAVGELIYTDRTYTFTNVASLGGKTYIKTANNDKYSTASSYMTFTVNQNVTVYVAHDDTIAPKPSWLSPFTDTGENVTTSQGATYSLYRKDFNAGTVTLGGNAGGVSSSMYSVIITPPASAPTQATGPSPANGASGIAPTDVTLSWAAGSGATSHNVYFGTSSPGAYQGNQTGTTFDPGTMSVGTTYYWRIDEVNTSGTATGPVWSFTTTTNTAFVNTHVTFDDGTPGILTANSWVSYSSGKALLGTNGELGLPWFPTSTARTFSAVFTCYNVSDLLNASDSIICGFQNSWMPGVLAKTSGIGNVLKVGCYDNSYAGGGEAVPAGTTKVSVKMTVDVATGMTHCFAAYDGDAAAGGLPARYHWVGSYASGTWSSAQTLRLQNSSASAGFQIDDVIVSWNNTPPIANGAGAYWGASSAVSSPTSAHTFAAAAVNGTVSGLNLTLNRTDGPCDPLWVYNCNALSTATSTTSRTVALIIPIDLRGWLWWDDPSTYRTIAASGQYHNTCEYASMYTSEYPIAVVSNGTNAICLAIPLEPARPVRFMYDAQNLQLRAEFDFGFYYSATDPGMYFNNRADATVYAYQVSGTTQAFRNGLDYFYDLHGQELVRRAGTGGVFVTKTCPASIDNIQDFHIAWNDYGIHGIRHYDYDSVHGQWLDRLSWNEQHGIKGFVYTLPATSYRFLTRSYSGTYTATFDGSPAHTGGLTLGASPSGSVTYTNNKAVIAPTGKLTVAGCTDRDAAERLVVQFTILNMADFANVTQSMLGVNVGSQLFGVKRSTGTYGTGNIWKAGAWGYQYDALGGQFDTRDGKAIPSCSTVTIRLVVSPNIDNCTYVWASYDGGAFEYVGRYLYQGGQWTWSAYGYGTLSIYNKSGTALQIDNLIVTHYSGSTPSSTYSSYVAQYAEERDMGNPEQQAGAVSYARDKNGNIIQGSSYGGTYPFFANLDIVRPQSSWPYMSFYEYIRSLFLAESLGWDGWPVGKTSGYFHDLTLNGIFWNDYDKTHFEVATNPLTFDRSNGNAACVGGLWSNHAFVRAVANEHHTHGQLNNLNECFGTDPYRNYLMMAYADISGREVMIDDSNGNFTPPSREDLLHSRSCAARRPNWLLGYSYDRFTSQSVCLKYMQFCMFYGVFPSFVMNINGSAYEDYYWANPTLYNRDRAYWNLYMTATQKIDSAGWEPVTRATVNSGCYIERWGNAATDDLYFTVYNPSPSTGATMQVSLEGDKLGLTGHQIEAIEQVYTAYPVTISGNGSSAPSLEFWIDAQSCRVIKVRTVQ